MRRKSKRCFAGCPGQRRLFRQRCLIRQRDQSFAHASIRLHSASRVHGRDNFLRKRRGLRCDSGNLIDEIGRTAHQGLELTLFLIVDKQLFGQYGLVVKHVNKEAECPYVIAQLLERAR